MFHLELDDRSMSKKTATSTPKTTRERRRKDLKKSCHIRRNARLAVDTRMYSIHIKQTGRVKVQLLSSLNLTQLSVLFLHGPGTYNGILV
ncbi:hypothetical protein F2P81_010765 [Scophthalmus maximus]|uniref:Uncharacterized protein n=1 Tax=Scophthalmus maximus TaxID=52904 RepID=A0A6A4T3W7_SCOMX|nr:hypothetical protein F2P81_010765 [Scophthalmus maximus]